MNNTGLLKPLPKTNRTLLRLGLIVISGVLLSLMGALSNPFPEREPPKQYLEGFVKDDTFSVFTFFNIANDGKAIPTLILHEKETGIKLVFEKLEINENEGFLLSYKKGGIVEENCVYFSNKSFGNFCPNGPNDSNGKGYSVWNNLKAETLNLLEDREIFDFNGLRYISPNS